MAHFKCLIRGEAFHDIVDGRDGPIGFYVNRPVEATNPEQARIAVLEEFRTELQTWGWAAKGGQVSVEEIEEIDVSELPSIGLGCVVFPDDAPEAPNLSSPFLLISVGGFSVLSEPLSDPWLMTKTAMREFHNAVCYDSSGMTCTITDVTPLRDLTLLDRMAPWRKIQVELVLQSGPNLSLAEVRAKLVSILADDSAIADFLKMPAPDAIARVKGAQSPLELIEAAAAIV